MSKKEMVETTTRETETEMKHQIYKLRGMDKSHSNELYMVNITRRVRKLNLRRKSNYKYMEKIHTERNCRCMKQI